MTATTTERDVPLGITMDVACDAYVAHADIEPDPEQPRTDADAELKASIKARGIQEALIVRPHPTRPQKFMIINGERRWRGAEGVQREIPINIRYDLENAGDRLLLQLVTNQHRSMKPLDEARAWKRILDEKGWTQAQLAKELGVDRSTLGDRIRLAQLDPAWIALIEDGTLGISHAPILYKYREQDAATQTRVAVAVRPVVENLRRSGRSFEVDVFEQFAVHAFNSPAYAESTDAVNDVARAIGAPGVSGDDEGDGSLAPDFENFEARDAAGRDPEIRIAHKLALEIEALDGKRGSAKRVAKLQKELHAMKLWEPFRFAHVPSGSKTSGFDAFVEYWRKNNDIGVRHSGAPDRPQELLAERYGVPNITHAVIRNGPPWFRAAFMSQVSNLESSIGFLVDVEHGGSMGAAWGNGPEQWTKRLKARIREERQQVIDARVAFGEKANFAEGATDRFIASIKERETARITKIRDKNKDADAEELDRWNNRPRPSREYSDREILDAIERLRLTVTFADEPREHWMARDDWNDVMDGGEGETLREAVAVAIEAREREEREGTLVDILGQESEEQETETADV